ncbi:3-deoxy-D-manno-octulosonate 8-phosphate phosphatase KdsC [Abditibacteriota bacterium]|nr:3-deoxy-D-manno-octulosonate 8-phosphate phosphatase KdsC [Abditibacteriota bacterium]
MHSPLSSFSTRIERAEVTPARWAGVQLLACDVDGVLTDGSLTFDSNGELIQTFYVRDGFGLVAARRAGIKIAWVSGRPSKVAKHRFDELGLDFCLLACDDKATALLDLQKQLNIGPESCCFIGDDVPDLAAFTVCGLKVAVSDAEPVVVSRADYITRARGGRGAVREIIDLMLSARGYWDMMLDMFENPRAPKPEASQK